MPPTYFGKYRGKVENNIDPMMQGRVQVSCAAVLGDGRMSWAMPCVPYAGSGVGFFAIPPVGANVWVEFEGGNPDYPIWGGCFWGIGEAPAAPAIPLMKMLKTDAITMTLSDLPGAGGFKLEVNPPAVALPFTLNVDSTGVQLEYAAVKITMGPAEMELSNGAASVKLTPIMVSLNSGALEVM
jgi:hypothetical protein